MRVKLVHARFDSVGAFDGFSAIPDRQTLRDVIEYIRSSAVLSPERSYLSLARLRGSSIGSV